MNRVKRAARRRYLRDVKPTGPNRFIAGREPERVRLATGRLQTEFALLNEPPKLYQHKENKQVPGSRRKGTRRRWWITEYFLPMSLQELADEGFLQFPQMLLLTSGNPATTGEMTETPQNNVETDIKDQV